MWTVFLEAYDLIFEYLSNASREEALRVIEFNFEQGNLTHNFYQKRSPYLWECADKKVHLVPEKNVSQFLKDHHVNSTE